MLSIGFEPERSSVHDRKKQVEHNYAWAPAPNDAKRIRAIRAPWNFPAQLAQRVG
jgi:hypothetical protein